MILAGTMVLVTPIAPFRAIAQESSGGDPFGLLAVMPQGVGIAEQLVVPMSWLSIPAPIYRIGDWVVLTDASNIDQGPYLVIDTDFGFSLTISVPTNSGNGPITLKTQLSTVRFATASEIAGARAR